MGACRRSAFLRTGLSSPRRALLLVMKPYQCSSECTFGVVGGSPNRCARMYASHTREGPSKRAFHLKYSLLLRGREFLGCWPNRRPNLQIMRVWMKRLVGRNRTDDPLNWSHAYWLSDSPASMKLLLVSRAAEVQR